MDVAIYTAELFMHQLVLI